MKPATPLIDIEEDEKFDSILLKRLAKIVEVLHDLED
jgi:hypothetical protein